MQVTLQSFRRALRTTALCGSLLAFPLIAQAFNPNDGDDGSTTSARTVSTLPSTASLDYNPATGTAPAVRHTAAILPPTTPLYAPQPKLVFPPLPGSGRQLPDENAAAIGVAPVAVTPAPQFPPVDAATVARANAEMAASGTPAVIAPPTQGFIAPAPLVATTHPLPEQLNAAVPTTIVTPVPAQATAENLGAPQLSDASRSVLSKIPSKLDSTPATKGKNAKLDLNRTTPAVKALVAKDPKVDSYDSAGLSIKVQRPGLDTNFELNRAYTALMDGDYEIAIDTYKNILSAEPKNEDALFGLASTYHRIGKLDQARPLYAQLLKQNPNDRDALNNFLALVSEEAPQDALAELERLEQRNPDFSPIPAQESIVLAKLGMQEQSREKMLRAIELAPNNMTYKYDLAILLDRQGDYADASAVYRLLIEAAMNGDKLPATAETLQKRLNYITSASAPVTTTGG